MLSFGSLACIARLMCFNDLFGEWELELFVEASQETKDLWVWMTEAFVP